MIKIVKKLTKFIKNNTNCPKIANNCEYQQKNHENWKISEKMIKSETFVIK